VDRGAPDPARSGHVRVRRSRLRRRPFPGAAGAPLPSRRGRAGTRLRVAGRVQRHLHGRDAAGVPAQRALLFGSDPDAQGLHPWPARPSTGAARRTAPGRAGAPPPRGRHGDELTMAPTPKRPLARLLWRYFRLVDGRLALAGLCMIVGAALDLLKAWPLKIII